MFLLRAKIRPIFAFSAKSFFDGQGFLKNDQNREIWPSNRPNGNAECEEQWGLWRRCQQHLIICSGCMQHKFDSFNDIFQLDEISEQLDASEAEFSHIQSF